MRLDIIAVANGWVINITAPGANGEIQTMSFICPTTDDIKKVVSSTITEYINEVKSDPVDSEPGPDRAERRRRK